MLLRSRASVVACGVLLVALACARPMPRGTSAASPQSAVDELLAVDRAFSAAAARTDAATAISAMFADDIIMPTPQGRFAEGAAQALEALRANAALARAHAEWTPVRGGVSADGQHGFTFGYMVLHGDSATTLLKYLAYWVKRPEGWRVAAYKRARRPDGDVSLAMMAPSLPTRLVAPTRDASTIAHWAASLKAAEDSFSAQAQRIGLGPAFVENGSADAVNMGGPTSAEFIVGAHAIGSRFTDGAAPASSPVSWGADKVVVASSGDLGVTFGIIRPNAPAAGAAAPGQPFFTIWRRASTKEPWRYIAE